MKDIKHYEGLYAVDEKGNVWSLKHTSSRRKGILKPYVNTGGYLRVNLYDELGKVKKHYVHRLVAKTYLPNPKNYPHVNHIIPNKTNNEVENLEWCDEKYNIAESRRLGLQKDRKVRAFSIISGETKHFNNIRDAATSFTGKYWSFSYQIKKYGSHFYYGVWRIEVMSA